jgi:hypothetical protein
MAQTRKYYLKNNYFYLEVKGQGPTKVITVRDTPLFGHAPTYVIPNIIDLSEYLERQKKVMVRTSFAEKKRMKKRKKKS